MDLSPKWDYVLATAAERLDHNKTARHVARYGTDIEVLGVAGEIAARRFLGLSENLHTHFDGGGDLVWRGWLIDVKATRLTPRLEYRFLQWPASKPVKTEIVLLTAVDINNRLATVVGMAYAKDVHEAPVNSTRDYPCHEIPVRNLRPIWELFTLDAKSIRLREAA